MTDILPTSQIKAYIVLYDGLKTVLDASAPVTGVSIEQHVDASVTKSLASDFLVSAFGDRPVSINISGMCLLGCSNSNSSLIDFYKRNKLSADPRARVKVGISINGKTQTFVCVLVSMTITGTAKLNEAGACSYSLSMLGVDI